MEKEMSDGLDELFVTVAAEVAEAETPTEVAVETPEVEIDNEEAPEADTPVKEPADVDNQDTEETDTPEVTEPVESFDWKQYADQLVPIVVDGKEEMVTLSELRDGNMRHADYTRKTQSLAEHEKQAQWAQEVQEAWKIDPVGTAKAFMEAYGVKLGEDNAPVNALDDLDDDVRPFAAETLKTRQELEETQRALAEIQNRALLDDVQREVRGLQERFGTDFDPEPTLYLAAEKNIRLEDAHAILFGQRQMKAALANKQVDAQTADAAAAAQAEANIAKAQAKKAASTTQTKSFKASDIPADDFDDIGELMEQLMASEGS